MRKGIYIRLKQTKELAPEQEALLQLFLANNHLKKNIDCICSRFNITNPQYNVLRILKGALPEGYPRCEIIPRMVDQAPDVTRIIDNLEKQELIERYTSSEDKRLSLTRITSKGVDLLKSMEEEMNGVAVNLKIDLTDEEIENLSAICEKIYFKDK
jgi:DNA-binding MarR family transcriptional regulator